MCLIYTYCAIIGRVADCKVAGVSDPNCAAGGNSHISSSSDVVYVDDSDNNEVIVISDS